MVAKVVFEHAIGDRLSKTAAARKQILAKALPKIEEYYSELSKNKRIADDAITPAARKGALDLYNTVVADGRYVDLLRTDPGQAAAKLGVTASAESISAITAIESQIRNPGGSVEGPVEAVIAVAVVIACAKPAEGVVIEDSALVRARL